jgi:hypothetical protein
MYDLMGGLESRLESNRRKSKTIIVTMLLSSCLAYYFWYTKERPAPHTCKKIDERKKKETGMDTVP